MTTFVIAMTLLLAGMSTLLVGTDWLDRVSEERGLLDPEATPEMAPAHTGRSTR